MKEQKAKEARLSEMRDIATFVDHVLSTNVLYITQILEIKKRFTISGKDINFLVFPGEKTITIWMPDVSVCIPIKHMSLKEVQNNFSMFEDAWFDFVAELTKVIGYEIEEETTALNVGDVVKGILGRSAKKVEGQPVFQGTIFGTQLKEKEEIYRKASAIASVLSEEDTVLFSGDTFGIIFGE